MAYRKLNFNKKFIKLADYSQGDELVEGTYLGTTDNKFGGLNHEFRKDDGEVVSISAGTLTYMLENVTEGSKVKVIYDGMVKLDKGNFKGKEAHQFEIYVDEIEVKVKESKEAPKKAEEGKQLSLDDLE